MLDVWIKACLELMGLDSSWIKTKHDRCIPLIKELLQGEDISLNIRQDLYQELAAVSSVNGEVDPDFFKVWLRNRVEIRRHS